VSRLDLATNLANALDEPALLLPPRGEPRQVGLQVGASGRDCAKAFLMVDAECRLALEHARLHGEVIEPPARVFHRAGRRLLA
jgi:hypothetical protein